MHINLFMYELIHRSLWFFSDASLIGNYDVKRCYKVDITFHYQISGGLTSSTIVKTKSKFTSLFQRVSYLLGLLPVCKDVTTSSEEIIGSPPGVSSVFFRLPLIFTASSAMADDQVSAKLTNCINTAKSTSYKAIMDNNAPGITQDDVTYRKYNLSTISDKRSCCGGDIPPPCCSAGSVKVSSTKCGKKLVSVSIYQLLCSFERLGRTLLV